ncbi:MAG: arylsulfatase [Bacteroidales bacterium]|nr:arylsulfatase [Bacteroidales bacterium]MCF8389932.1 arylsulfatase [Bacteroidales bacterium]
MKAGKTSIGIISAFITMVSGCQNSEIVNEHNRPNIILILADDLGYGDLGCYGQTKISTPNTDLLASQGISFISHYSGSTVCAPSRNCLLTGQTTGHATIRGNGFGDERIPLNSNDTTLAMILKNAGYKTGIFGKWGLGESGSGSDPNNKGFDEWFGYLNQKHAHDYYSNYLYHNTDSIEIKENKNSRTIFTQDLFTQKALNFISTNKNTPFFLFLPYTLPHAEIVAPEKEMDRYQYKFPEYPFQGSDSYPPNQSPRATYATMVSMLDKDLGKIINLLDSLEIEENTLIIFTSDNGPEALGKHGCDPDFFNSTGGLRGVKRNLYEGGIRVPLIIRWPGKINENTKTDFVSASWDLLPTITDILSIRNPKNTDGVSLLPTLTGNGKQKEHDFLYWEFHHPIEGSQCAILKDNWKGIFYFNDSINELYNISSDPTESFNLADDEPEKLFELKKLVMDYRTESPYWNFHSTIE